MKKAFLFISVSSLIIFLAGCSLQLNNNTNPSGGEVTTMENPDVSGQILDQSAPQSEPSSASGGNQPSADSGNPDQSTSNQTNNTQPNMPTVVIDQNKSYTAILHTEAGDIEVALNAKETPITVNNFVWLSQKGFYDGTIFHRVMKGFMIQGGDPKGDGTGGPGYQFKDEAFTGEYARGTIAMANAGPNTNGSQFFIMHANYPLPKNYVIFGHVIKGLEAVDKIAEAPVTTGPSGEPSKPVTPVKVTSVEIIEK